MWCSRGAARRGLVSSTAHFGPMVGYSPATIVLAGSNRSGGGGNKTAKAFDGKGSRVGDPASLWAVTRVNAEQASKPVMWEPTRLRNGEGHRRWGRRTRDAPSGPTGVVAAARRHRRRHETREAPAVAARDRQRDAREGQARPSGVTERFVVPRKPGNAGGGKEPQFKVNVRSGKEPVD